MSMHLENPWLLFVIIPAIGLALIPYLRVPKQRRNTRNRVISLVLHCVMLLLVVFMLAGLSFTFTQVSVKKDVILLVDASDSTLSSKEEMDEFINSVLDEVDKEHRVGIVTFGGDCVYAAELDKDPREVKKQYSEQKQTPVGDATDISAALKYARSILSSPEDGRIILLSDGRQTDNNAMSTVKSLSEEGVRVDTVYFPSSGKYVEAQISAVEVQVSGGSADIIVTVDSTVAQDDAKLTLYDEDDLVEEREIHLSGGSDNFSFNHTVIDSRMHTVKLVLEPEKGKDTLTKNNTYYSYINLNSSTKVLLVDGSGNGATDLKGILDESFEVDRVSLNQLPTSIEALCEYGEVILVNVSNADISRNGFDDMLTEYVSTYGGGLYTVGGDNAYQEEDMKGSKFEELLPVNANTDAKSLGLLLIIDSSGSMKETASGTNMTRMELAIDAAVASVDALSPDDYVGVISFNMNAEAVTDMWSLDRKEDIKRHIRGIKTATGTYYSRALELARNMITGFDKTELKHIIFLTDGEPVDPSKKEIIEQVGRIARNNVTLSTIALGASVPTDTAKEMAEVGGGEFYDVTRESELINVMVKETTRAAGSYINQVEFTPTIESHTPAVSGIEELPKLGGFYGTRMKKNATMVIGNKSDPIYAEWSYGSGRVGSFMCDLEGVWSEEFMQSDNGLKFIRNSVASVISKREISNQTVSVDFSRDNYTVQTVVRAILEPGESVSAKLISPSGEEASLKLEKLSSARFATSFKADEQGVYTVRITKGGEEYNSYFAFSYSTEYSAFADDNTCFRFMENISLEGKGSMLFTAEKMFDEKSEMTESQSDPTLVLLIICSVLFLLDIVVRKFKLKLPREIKEERRAKSVAGGRTDNVV